MRTRVDCRTAQQRMSVALVGELPRTDRLEAEAHVARCLRCANTLADLRATTIALDRAYAPLRAVTVRLSPARARLAARTPLPAPSPALRLARITARLSEVALAAAVTAFAFVGATSVTPEPRVIDDAQTSELQLTHVTSRLDDAAFVRWMRLERYVPPDDLLDPTSTIEPSIAPHGGGGFNR